MNELSPAAKRLEDYWESSDVVREICDYERMVQVVFRLDPDAEPPSSEVEALAQSLEVEFGDFLKASPENWLRRATAIQERADASMNGASNG